MKATRLPQSPWFVFRSTYATLAVLTLFLLPSPAPLLAADSSGLSASVVAQLQTLQSEKRARTPAQQKLNTQLIYKLKQKRGELAALGLSSIRASLDVRPDGQVLVDIHANVTDALLAQIKQGGGTVVASVPQFDEVRAWVTLERVEELAALGDVKFIRPAEQAFTNVGPINSEGDTNHRALMARTNFGVSGTGIKVGVLSDSVDFLAASQLSGELGAVTVLQDVAGTGEGTAMLEIVHDLAPDSPLYFATAFISAASFAFNILNLWTNGCTVIVDDVGYFSESPFQDDVIARAVNTVTAGGALYFSSAANSGNKDDNTSGTWEGDYVDAGPAGGVLAGAGNLHSFGVSNYNTCIAGGSSRRVDLFWSDALGASANDYDLYVLNATGTAIVDQSSAFQTGTQNPYEAVGALNVGERIVILKFAGVARFLHLETGRARLSISTAGNTKGHSAATNAFSVAAVNVASVGGEPPFKGGAVNPVETFSSDGTRRVFYHADGTPITPGNFLSTGGAVRQKPDIAAADGGRTSVPGFDPFFGTSAAAPHAAAIAALIRSHNPAWNPFQIRSALTGTALDIEAAGVDRDSGAGIVMAEQALERLTAVPLPAALDTPLMSWSTGGISGWIGLSNVTHDAVDAGASAFIIHSQESWMESTVLGPGELRFWWKVSSESSFDFLELLVDGVIQPGGISGQVDWVRKTNTIAAGYHTVRFRYRKDSTVNVGTDRGWVDQVSYVPNLIPPAGPTNGGITSILLFVPDNSVPSAFRAALDFAGRTYQFYTDASLFNAALAASTPSNTLAIVDSIDTNPNFSSLISFVAGGGRSLLYYWDLDQDAPLATAFNVTAITDNFTPIPVNDWGGSAFFSGVTSPLPLLERGYNDDGDKVQPTAGGVAVAGYVASPAANQAAVVIGNSGRTILNAMALQDATGAPLQAVQLALNEIYYLLAPLHTGGRVAVLGAEATPGWNEDVRQKLLGTGAFVAVDVIQADLVTPTLGQLQTYAGVLAYSDYGFADSTVLGNNLADYVDGGGVVVVNTFALTGGAGLGILGRLSTGGYLPFVPGAYVSGTELTLVANHPDHPILAGVSSFSGGTLSFNNQVTLAPNSAVIAHWNNGVPLVMTRKTGAGNVVGLNFFPPSQTVRGDLWRTNTAGGQLMANALRWNGPTPVPPVTPINGGIASILLFVDDTSVPSLYQSALDYAGLSYTLFTDEVLFNAAVTASTPPTTLAIVDSINDFHTLSPLPAFVASGGRAIMYYWDLDGSPALATAFNATTVLDIFTPVPINDWGGSYFFGGVGSPLALFERGYNDDGDKLQPTAGGVAVAGHTASPAAGQACVVVGNSGRTILNSMALQDATSAPVQAAQLAMNEIYYLLAPLHTGGIVAVVGADSPGFVNDVRQKLLATAAFVAVDVVQADVVTPTLAQLQTYAGVLVYSDNVFNNSTTLGNNLADYVDGGGVVVVNTFALTDVTYGIGGRLLTGGYLPYLPAAYTSGTELTLGVNHPDHPIMAGVGSFSGGTLSFNNLVTLAPNSAVVARWNNSVPLVMTKKTGAGNVVGLNFFPVSETALGGCWRTNTAGGLLMANALRYNGITPVPPVTPTNGGITSILLFADDLSVPSAYQSALDYAGLPYTLFTDEASFNAAVTASTPLTTLAIVDSINLGHTLAPLPAFIANCGRALMYYWNLDGSPALAASFNATTVLDITTPVPVNDWGGSFFFAGVGSPLAMFERGYFDDGDKLQPTPGGVAVAGHTASPTAGQACVVVGNSGRTILNSMALQDATGAPIQAAQLALNEIFYLLAPAHGGGRVAVFGAETTPGWNEDVRQKLLATAAFEAVDVFQANAFTPTLAELQAYSAVLLYSDSPFNNSTALGHVLADYVDAGGGVVVSTFGLYNAGSGYGIDGRLLTGGYLPFVGGGFATALDLALVPDQAVHPILAGVGSLVGGTASYHDLVTLAPGGALVAHWSNGRPLVMTKVTGLGRVVGLNFFPPSETVRNDLWRTNSAGALLMANALRWSAVPDCDLKTNYVASTTFTNTGMVGVTISLAFDGTNFWAGSGGSTAGVRLARYTPGGLLVSTYSPGIDFRSLFADARGQLYARGYNTNRIMRQTTPGTFVSHVVLTGGSIDPQGSVVLNDIGNEYLALSNAVVQRWSTNGTFLGTVALAGFGAVPGESINYQNAHLVAAGNSFLTYNGNRTLSLWSPGGARLATTTLANAGALTTEATYTLSYCAGKVFICDGPTPGLWRGYDICTAPLRFSLTSPVRLAGGAFQMNLRATPARSYAIERSSNFLNWVSFTTNVALAPNTTITDAGAVGRTNLVYRARTQ